MSGIKLPIWAAKRRSRCVYWFLRASGTALWAMRICVVDAPAVETLMASSGSPAEYIPPRAPTDGTTARTAARVVWPGVESASGL